ncbi:TatD family deoxyribonuclease [Balamuthia mandrillaris]
MGKVCEPEIPMTRDLLSDSTEPLTLTCFFHFAAQDDRCIPYRDSGAAFPVSPRELAVLGNMENPGHTTNNTNSNANTRPGKARNSRVKQQQQSKKQQQQAAAKSPAGNKSAATYTASPSLPQRDLRATEALSFFDSHCHLDLILEREGAQTASQVIERFEGFYEQNFSDEAVDRVNASVDPTCSLPFHFHFDGCLQVCCFLSGYKVTKQMVESKPNVWATYGIHPHQASDYTDELEDEICQLMAHPKTVAWGEMGLDYFKNMSPAEVQRTVFEKQLKRAVSLGKPLVIHTREADEVSFMLALVFCFTLGLLSSRPLVPLFSCSPLLLLCFSVSKKKQTQGYFAHHERERSSRNKDPHALLWFRLGHG